MTASLSDLIARKAAIEREINEVQASARAEAVARIHALMQAHGLTAADLSVKPAGKASSKAVSRVAPKYRDPLSGMTWSGRGLKPKWLTSALDEGKSMSDFLI